MKIQNILWYNLSVAKTYELLKTSRIGLSQGEVKKRSKAFGLNVLPEKKKTGPAEIFFRQFKSVLVLVLVFACLISLFLKEYVDFLIILVAIAINVFLGFFQEYKAEKELASLKKYLTLSAKVYREGVLQQIDIKELVPGDVVVLEAGDQVPADIRLFEVHSFAVSQAILTGESNPVRKKTATLSASKKKKILLAERSNMVFKGTVVTEGRALGVVVATAIKTEIGKIATLLEQTQSDVTPLQLKLKKFSMILGAVILCLVTMILFIGLYRGMEFWDIFFIAMAAAVASVPEGLLVAVTVVLAIGMRRILKQKALVRKLLAAETLGSTTVVCVDKTGTITEGAMKALKIITFAKEYSSEKKTSDHDLENFIKASIFANNAEAKKEEVGYSFMGSPTEKAILQGSLQVWPMIENNHRIEEIPFSSLTKIMYALTRDNDELMWSAKGAPEVVLAKCKYFQEGGKNKKLNETTRKKWQNKFDEYSSQGYRILAVCYKKEKEEKIKNYQKNDFVFLGFWVLADPVRPFIKETIKLARQAGIKTVMITGDYKLTAMQIAKEIGLSVDKDKIIDGQELMSLSVDQLQERVKNVQVFARVSPKDKLKIVEAFQRNGEVVAMTGDGINDAPALKIADIGIAVGAGTDVTKSTADMVLIDNNFRTIILAIEQGRLIYSNIKKIIVYLLSGGFSEIILISGSLLFKLPLPITAAQILWINLITDGFPAAALTLEKSEKGLMQEKPVKKDFPLLDSEMKALIFVIGIVTDIILFTIFIYLFKMSFELSYIRTVIFATLGINSLFYVFSCKSLIRPIWQINLLDNKYLIYSFFAAISLQMLPIYTPFLREIFDLHILGFFDWMIIFGVGFLNMFFIELTKRIYFYKSHRVKK